MHERSGNFTGKFLSFLKTNHVPFFYGSLKHMITELLCAEQMWLFFKHDINTLWMVMENKFKFKVLMHVHVRPLELISCCLEAHGLAAMWGQRLQLRYTALSFLLPMQTEWIHMLSKVLLRRLTDPSAVLLLQPNIQDVIKTFDVHKIRTAVSDERSQADLEPGTQIRIYNMICLLYILKGSALLDSQIK